MNNTGMMKTTNFEKWKSELTVEKLISFTENIDKCLGILCPLENKCDLTKTCRNALYQWASSEVSA